MSSPEAQIYARALYDSLLANAGQQLREAAQQLRGGNTPSAERIEAALGPNVLPSVRNLIRAMSQEGHAALLPAVAEAFVTFGGTTAEPLASEVQSAEPLTAEQQERVTGDLRRKFGAGVSVTFTVDESLIGGLIIRVGDRVVDNSLRTRLGQLQRNLQAS